MDYIIVDQWSTNETAGGVLQLFIDDQIDFAFTNLEINPGRAHLYSPIIKFINLRQEKR